MFDAITSFFVFLIATAGGAAYINIKTKDTSIFLHVKEQQQKAELKTLKLELKELTEDFETTGEQFIQVMNKPSYTKIYDYDLLVITLQDIYWLSMILLFLVIIFNLCSIIYIYLKKTKTELK